MRSTPLIKKCSAAALCLSLQGQTANALGADGKCRILSLRGGGVHGAFETGVLRAIVENMPPEEVMYDYIGGVSVGAMNASIIASFPPGEEMEAVETMESVYAGKATSELFDFYTPSVLAPF